MSKFFISGLFVLLITAVGAQPIGHVVKKTKEFYISSDAKGDYRFFGYEFPDNNSQKMICFSSYRGDVNDNANKCPLGSYYDTGRMKPGDKINYITEVKGFGKMLYISATGKKAIFYLLKSSYSIK
jgi:hypothetical protein